MNQEQLQGIVQTWFAAYNQSQTDHQSWLDAIDSTTRQLWEPLMQPLIQSLKIQNIHQATLIPTGFLSFLPLHASWTPDENRPTKRHYALDNIHFTYAPNAKSLTAAQTIADRVGADSILAIDEPKHRYQEKDPKTGKYINEYKDVKPLPNSSREVEAAIATFQNSNIFRHEKATREAVIAALPHINVLHCSCHGSANLNAPLTSGLAMTGDGEAAILTLKDIFNLKLTEDGTGGIRLAILSACETGLQGIENADEAISLPTGLLQAGVAGAIASLWSVSDLSTMLLLTKFYDLWRDHHLPPDQALRQAQIWLRDSTNDEKVQELKPLLRSATRMSSDTAQELYDELSMEMLNDRTFAHPFHWAAFSYTGI